MTDHDPKRAVIVHYSDFCFPLLVDHFLASHKTPPLEKWLDLDATEEPMRDYAKLVLPILTADGSFDTRKCHDAIAARCVAASITPRRNAMPRKPDNPGTDAGNEDLRVCKCLVRTIWRDSGIQNNYLMLGTIEWFGKDLPFVT